MLSSEVTRRRLCGLEVVARQKGEEMGFGRMGLCERSGGAVDAVAVEFDVGR